MIRKFIMAGAMAAGLAFAQPALAGPYSDGLTKCLVQSSKEADRTVFIQWMFVTMSLDPAVKPLANISDSQRETYNRKVAVLIQRLILTDCRQESIDVMKYEGTVAFEASFEFFGKAAAEGLFGDPAVSKGLQDFSIYFDSDLWETFAKDTAKK